ncbi:MAG: butyryl-CoA:acetate CoA-transferase, partial [Clostridia bacterium]|nr:butyryl-CoA:acetate CoA-transferase [Clostridia bacterium]
DGASIQIGIGGVPDAVASIIADSDIKDLGMHTEFCTNGYMDLYNAGKITNRKKNIDKGVGLYATSAGTKEFYEWIDRNPEVGVRPVGYVNDPYVIGQLDDFISINGCIAVDLYGQVISESVGSRHISGTGGQVDYTLGAIKSKGGKGFICLPSTRTDRRGNVSSNIVPHFNGEIITTPRTHTMFVVTEHGAVNLLGQPNWQRAEMLISVADPMFRDDLIKAAEEQHVWRRSNKR